MVTFEKEFRITKAFYVLLAVLENEDCNQSTLYKSLGIGKQNGLKVARPLIRLKLIKKFKDGREKKMILTEEGLKIAKMFKTLIEEIRSNDRSIQTQKDHTQDSSQKQTQNRLLLRANNQP